MIKLRSGFIAVVCLIGISVAGVAILGGSTACEPPNDNTLGSGSTYDATQISNAGIIVAVGKQLDVPARGWVIAIATALQESSLRTIDHGDRDSVGLFQQRPSQGWGAPALLIDPRSAAQKFYQKLTTIPGWQTMPLTKAAQRVQRSAYPDAYAKWEPDATELASIASRNSPAIQELAQPCMSACPSSAAAGPCTGDAAVFARAKAWLTAWSDGPVPYLSSADLSSWFHGYRRDCSGYVSMALGLPGPGLNTIDLAKRSTVIPKADLQPGDLLIKPDTDLRGHVVLFEQWAAADMSSYWGYEQSGGGTHYRRIPYPYFGTYSMAPYRWRPAGNW